MADDRSVEITVDAFLRVKRQRDAAIACAEAAEAAIAAVRALCDMANERWGGEVPTGNIRRALDTGATT